MVPSPASDRTPVVVSVGGSVLLTGQGDTEYLEHLADLFRRLGAQRPLVVTVGGGRTAREYIQLGRALGLTEFELDEVGIEVTRLHARLLAARVGPPAPAHPPTTVPAVVEQLRTGSPVILGGTEPGHTTDGVAALVAVRIRAARVVNATDVDGVYDQDPRTHPNARRIERLSWPEFRAMVHSGTSGEAGQNFLFDRLGVDALARAKIPLLIVPGRDLSNLEAAITGRPCRGSRIGETGSEKTP
ncbi:MAG TPA: UMP kinase [Thermoplasmata archaeon]|nr:UMP kinase [Thermoplasmata archaeon]